MRPLALILALVMLAPLVVALSPPSKPLAFTASTGAGVGEIDLSWSPPASPGASPVAGYRVYRSLTPTGLVHLADLGNVLAFTDTTVPDGREYFYRVSAVNGDGEGPLSDVDPAQARSVPSAPTAFRTGTGPGTTNVTLQWGAPALDGLAPILDHRIYRASAWTGPFTLHATVSGSTFAFVDAVGALNTTFAYKVSALNVHGEGPPTEVRNGTTAHLASAPRNVDAAPIFPAQGIRVSWELPEDTGGIAIDAWFVWRSQDGGPFEPFTLVTPQIMGVTDETCSLLRPCSYKVAARNVLGLGAPSEATDPVSRAGFRESPIP